MKRVEVRDHATGRMHYYAVSSAGEGLFFRTEGQYAYQQLRGTGQFHATSLGWLVRKLRTRGMIAPADEVVGSWGW